MEKKRFIEILRSSGELAKDDRVALESLSYNYPWFVLPKVVLMRHYKLSGNFDEFNRLRDSISLSLVACSYFDLINGGLSFGVEYNIQDDLIGDFLSKHLGRLDINDSSNESQIDIVDEDDGCEVLVELADFFEKNEKKTEAIEIYRKLYLKFPEKSSYFASAIERLST